MKTLPYHVRKWYGSCRVIHAMDMSAGSCERCKTSIMVLAEQTEGKWSAVIVIATQVQGSAVADKSEWHAATCQI